VTRMLPDPQDDAAIEEWIADLRRASEAGELLEEIRWDDEWDAADAAWWAHCALEDHTAAIKRRRGERRRRRAWAWKRDQG
jgi:hypothetical protein